MDVVFCWFYRGVSRRIVMKKIKMKAGEMLSPIPAVMVSCGDMENSNIITIAWTGIVNSKPPMTYVSVRPERYSHDIIEKSGEFVINLVNEDLVFAMDHCGSTSGKDEDKFETMHLTKAKADKVSCPLIEESPVNIECKVVEVKRLGSHDMYLAEIVAVHAAEELMKESGRLALDEAGLVAYVHGEYFGLKSRRLGTYGYSVMKKKTAKKRRAKGLSYGGKKAHFEK